MKKFILPALICVGLLLPAITNTSNAAKYNHRLTTLIEGWVLSATSNNEEGNIKRIEIYRIPTGEFARAQDYAGTSNFAAIDLQGLPHGNFSARVYCTNVVATKQFKL